MNNLLTIPQGRKRIRAGRLCLLLGLTVMLYLMLFHEFSSLAEALRTARP